MKKTVLLIVSIFMIFSMLVACSGQPAAPAAEEPAAEEASPTEETEGVMGDETDTLTLAITTDPKSLDPRTIGGDFNFTVLAYVSDRLVQFSQQKGDFEPVLATSWDHLDDLTWQFKLREGVKFHNGEPFNAEAVKYTVESTLDPDAAYPNASWISDVTKVEIVDDYTINFVTDKPSRDMLANLAYLFMLPPVAAEELGPDFGVQTIGTGPYKMVEYIPNDHIALTRNEDYWGEAPTMKNLVIKFLAEDATRLAALESGEVSIIPNVSPDAIEDLRANENLDVVVADPARIMHLAFIMNRPPFDNLKLREAFNYAVDRQAIVDTIMLNLATVADAHLFHPSTVGFNPDLPPFSYDPEKAKALLAEAGYPDGITVTLGCPNGRYLRDKMVCEALVGQFAEVGITVDMEASEWGTFWDKAITNHEYDMFMLGWLSLESAYTELTWWFKSGESKNLYSNPEVDALIDLTQTAATDEEALNALKEAQAKIWADVPWIPLYFQPNIYAKDAALKGVVLSEVPPLMDFSKAYFEN